MRGWILLSLVVAMTACGRKKQPRTPTAPAWMETQVEAQAKEIAPEASSVTPLFRKIAYSSNDNTRWPLQLEKGHCYLFSTVGDETVQSIYVLLWDTEGDRQFAEEQPGPGIVAEYCPTESGTHEFEVKIAEGHGHYLTRVFSKKPGAPAAGGGAVATVAPAPAPETRPAASAPAATPAGDPLADRIRSMAAAVDGAEPVGEMREGAADVTDWYVALESSKCYWFFAAGDSAVERLSLFLWDPNEKRVADSKSETSQVELGHCPQASGMYHVQAKVAEGAGRYGMSVYAKPR